MVIRHPSVSLVFNPLVLNLYLGLGLWLLRGLLVLVGVRVLLLVLRQTELRAVALEWVEGSRLEGRVLRGERHSAGEVVATRVHLHSHRRARTLGFRLFKAAS